MAAPSPPPPRLELTTSLRDSQQRLLDAMLVRVRDVYGLINASQCGSGKTLQALALSYYAARGPVLIVCLPSLVGSILSEIHQHHARGTVRSNERRRRHAVHATDNVIVLPSVRTPVDWPAVTQRLRSATEAGELVYVIVTYDAVAAAYKQTRHCLGLATATTSTAARQRRPARRQQQHRRARETARRSGGHLRHLQTLFTRVIEHGSAAGHALLNAVFGSSDDDDDDDDDDGGGEPRNSSIRAYMRRASARCRADFEASPLRSNAAAAAAFAHLAPLDAATQRIVCPPRGAPLWPLEQADDGLVVLLQTVWAGIVFDEAHVLRSLHSQRTQACLRLATTAAGFRVALTATPVNNGLCDAVALLYCIGATAPAHGGFAWSAHMDETAAALEETADGMERLIGAVRRVMHSHLVRITLASCLPPAFARHAPDVAPVRIVTLPWQSDTERELYAHFLRTQAATAETPQPSVAPATAGSIMAQLARLTQVTCVPALASKEHAASAASVEALRALPHDVLHAPLLVGSTKMRMLRRVADCIYAAAPRARIVVFAEHVGAVAVAAVVLHAALGGRGDIVAHETGAAAGGNATVCAIDGRMSHAARTDALAAFNVRHSSMRALVATYDSLAHGVSLFGCTHVVMLSARWNPQVLEQARSRAIRLTSLTDPAQPPVETLILAVADSIDMVQLAVAYNKQARNDAVIDVTRTDVPPATGIHYDESLFASLRNVDDLIERVRLLMPPIVPLDSDSV